MPRAVPRAASKYGGRRAAVGLVPPRRLRAAQRDLPLLTGRQVGRCRGLPIVQDDVERLLLLRRPALCGCMLGAPARCGCRAQWQVEASLQWKLRRRPEGLCPGELRSNVWHSALQNLDLRPGWVSCEHSADRDEFEV